METALYSMMFCGLYVFKGHQTGNKDSQAQLQI